MTVKQCKTQVTRRSLFKEIAGAGLLSTAGRLAWGQDQASPSAPPVQRGQRTQHMKITKVEPILTGGDVFVRIETDAGIMGYGDATNNFIPYSVEGMLKDVIPYLIGEDPERIEYLWQVCFRRRFYRGGPSTGAALAGIDQALWDIKGKTYGVPVYQLLGGLARTKVRVYGHVSGNTAEEAARQAKQRVAKGITAIRFRAFHKTIAKQYVNYLRPDVSHCGGISEIKKIAAMAEAYYIDLIPHNNAGPLGSAATLHAALAIPNITMIEAPWVNGEGEGDVVGSALLQWSNHPAQ